MKLLINSKPVEVKIESISHDKVLFSVNGRCYLVEEEANVPSMPQDKGSFKPASKSTTSNKNKSQNQSLNKILSPIPGVIAKILVAEGAEIKAGEAVLILEAMKMQNRVTATADAVIKRIHVQEGQEVADGEELIELA